MYAQGRILQNVFTNDHNYAHNDEKMQADKKGSSIFISGHERCLTRLRTSLQWKSMRRQEPPRRRRYNSEEAFLTLDVQNLSLHSVVQGSYLHFTS